MGILISELGSESSLKSDDESNGFLEMILDEQEDRKITAATKNKKHFPFISFIKY
jgi:hypothetical protein